MIIKDKSNARIHDAKSVEAIQKSLQNLGAGRSILIDKDDVIIAGNGVHASAEALGIPVRVIESDGSELIAIKRTDLSEADPRRKALAIADNRAGDLSFFDDELLRDLLSQCAEFQLAAGFTAEQVKELSALNSALDDLVENNFASTLKAGSNLYAVTFTFDKVSECAVADYIKAHGKKTLSDEILTLCREAYHA